jgi:serpin B
MPDGIRVISAFTGAFFAAAADAPGNLVCSPYSIDLALAMTRNGAAGSTAKEVDSVLGVTSLDRLNAGFNAVSQLLASRAGTKHQADGVETEVALEVASTVFGQQDTTWLPAFLDTLAESYGAGVELVDYRGAREAARARINDWTKVQTDGAIAEIIRTGVLDGLTRMVLVNAIHLEAPWATPFSTSATRQGLFHTAGGGRVQADMMRLLATGAEVAKGDGWTGAQPTVCASGV